MPQFLGEIKLLLGEIQHFLPQMKLLLGEMRQILRAKRRFLAETPRFLEAPGHFLQEIPRFFGRGSQAFTSFPTLLTGFVRSWKGLAETSTVWSGPGKGLGKSCTAFGETVPVWAKRCQFLRKPVQVSRGPGRYLSKAGIWLAKQVPFRGKAAPNRDEAPTFWANASPFSENGYSFLA